MKNQDKEMQVRFPVIVAEFKVISEDDEFYLHKWIDEFICKKLKTALFFDMKKQSFYFCREVEEGETYIKKKGAMTFEDNIKNMNRNFMLTSRFICIFTGNKKKDHKKIYEAV